jgi:hypothetical protein
LKAKRDKLSFDIDEIIDDTILFDGIIKEGEVQER